MGATPALTTSSPPPVPSLRPGGSSRRDCGATLPPRRLDAREGAVGRLSEGGQGRRSRGRRSRGRSRRRRRRRRRSGLILAREGYLMPNAGASKEGSSRKKAGQKDFIHTGGGGERGSGGQGGGYPRGKARSADRRGTTGEQEGCQGHHEWRRGVLAFWRDVDRVPPICFLPQANN